VIIGEKDVCYSSQAKIFSEKFIHWKTLKLCPENESINSVKAQSYFSMEADLDVHFCSLRIFFSGFYFC